MSELKPDEAHCKKCGAPVRFGNVNTGKAYTVGIALDAEKVPHGAYDLVEHETEEGLATGKWLAIYVLLALVGALAFGLGWRYGAGAR